MNDSFTTVCQFSNWAFCCHSGLSSNSLSILLQWHFHSTFCYLQSQVQFGNMTSVVSSSGPTHLLGLFFLFPAPQALASLQTYKSALPLFMLLPLSRISVFFSPPTPATHCLVNMYRSFRILLKFTCLKPWLMAYHPDPQIDKEALSPDLLTQNTDTFIIHGWCLTATLWGRHCSTAAVWSCWDGAQAPLGQGSGIRYPWIKYWEA